MKKYIAIYGGTSLTPETATFIEELSYALLNDPDIILVTGGFDHSEKEPGAVSTDISVCRGAKRFSLEKGRKLETILETWLPDAEKDRLKEGVVRFHDGKVIEIEGESAQARRFRIVRDVDILVTIKGKKHTAMILDNAFTLNKPALPLPFTGGDSVKYWQANKQRIINWFGIGSELSDELEKATPLTPQRRGLMIDGIVNAVTMGIIYESASKLKYEEEERRWELEAGSSLDDKPYAGTENPSTSLNTSVEMAEPEYIPPIEKSAGLPAAKQANFFLSYSHEDEKLKVQLDKHLTALKRSSRIAVWSDVEIHGGDSWDEAVKQHMLIADFILLLVSSDFLASSYIWNTELKLAIERQRSGASKVIPVYLRRCDLDDTPIRDLKGYPIDGIPVNSVPERDQDEIFYNIVMNIRAELSNWSGN